MDNATHAHEFPRHRGELTECWLTRVLRNRGVLQRAKVQHMRVSPLGSGAAGCQTVRLVPEYDVDEPGAPRSLVVKLTPQGQRARQLRQELGSAERELRFYAQLARRTPELTARCLHAELESGSGRYALVLEEACGNVGMLSLQSLELALEELARLHAVNWNRPGTLEWATDTFSQLDRHRQRVAGALEQLEARLADALPATVAAAARLYSEELVALRGTEVGAPMTVLHGDPTPHHWLMARGEATLVDWQSLSVGAPGRDVARLIASAMPALLRISQERRLLAVYHSALRWHGVVDYRIADCFADYRRGLLDAAARTVLTAASTEEHASPGRAEVEGTSADQLARMERALVENEVLPRMRAELAWQRAA